MSNCKKNRLRVAIIGFGLHRAKSRVLPEFRRHILEALSLDCDVHCFLHSPILTEGFFNARNSEMVETQSSESTLREIHHHLDSSEKKWFLKIQTEDQKCSDVSNNISQYLTQKDPYENDYVSVKGIVRFLHSLKRATQLALSSGLTFDYFVFIRNDIIPLHCITSKTLSKVSEGELVHPNNELYPLKGLCPSNDRFAIAADLKTALIYGLRFDEALAFSQTQSLHTEMFLSSVLTSRRINVKLLPLFFRRTRCSGQITDEQVQKLYEEYLLANFDEI